MVIAVAPKKPPNTELRRARQSMFGKLGLFREGVNPVRSRKRTFIEEFVVDLVAVAAIPTAIAFTVNAVENSPTPPRVDKTPTPPLVTVLDTKPDQYQAIVESNGEVRPAHGLDLVALAGGRVRELSAQFRTGNKVAKGTVLLSLDDVEHRAAVASARQRLEEAKVNLLDEQRQARVAKQDWARRGDGREPNSPLVLREPQMASARARVEAAKANLKHAQAQLAHTQLVAPFDAVVVDRTISPDAYLAAGSSAGKLYAIDYAEIRVALTPKQWKLLPEVAAMEPALIRQVDTSDFQWTGRALNSLNLVNSQTRMRELIVQVARPLDQTPPLLPGSFVTVRLSGRPTAGLLKVPATALTADGFVWHVTPESYLARFSTTPLFSIDTSLFIPAPAHLTSVNIVRQPLTSYQPGTLVLARPYDTVQ